MSDLLSTNAQWLDCRAMAQYERGHAQGSIHIPFDQLFDRLHELPVAEKPLIVIITSAAESANIVDFFSSRKNTLEHIVIWSEALADELNKAGLLETGCSSCRAWQAAPLLDQFILEILPNGFEGNALDIACGSGRNAVRLADEGFSVLAVDNNQDALNRTENLATHNNAAVETLLLDLEIEGNPFEGVAPQSFDIIMVFRYLHRPLFPYIRDMIKPGGWIIYQTFMVGCEQIGRPRNPRFLLQENELAEIFADYTIVKNDIEQLDDGRPVSSFIAQREKTS